MTTTPGDIFQAALEVNAPVECCYRVWCDYERFPSFMHNVKAARHLGGNIWRWTLKGKYSNESVLDLAMEEDAPHRTIRAKSVHEPDFDLMMEVTFTPVNRTNTRIVISMTTSPLNLPLVGLLKELNGLSEADIRQSLHESKTRIEAPLGPETAHLAIQGRTAEER